MKKLDYNIPYCGFRDLDFTHCFTGVYMYLEGIRGNDDYGCAKKKGKPCDGCGNCGQSLGSLQERQFFLFDTMSGRSATVRGWGKKPTAIFREIYDTEDMVDFIMGYAGYGYVRYTDNLMEHIRASIDNNTPVLARLKKDGKPYLDDGKADSFRTTIGYDGDKLCMADPKGAQNPPKKAPKLGEIESVYVITGKAERKYTLLDVLQRIRRVMEFDREAGTWDEYIHAFEKYWERLKDHSLKELKQLHKNAWDAAIWNCHNFAEAFRIYQCPQRFQNWIYDEFKGPKIKDLCDRISWAYDNSHTHQWQLRSLYETRDWSKKYYNEMEWGMCENAILVLRKIKEDDDIVYHAVCEMIAILEEDKANAI